MKNAFLILWLAGGLVAGSAVASEAKLQSSRSDIFDTKALRHGAEFYADYCLGCHSLKQIRYSTIAKDMGWTEADLRRKLLSATAKPQDVVKSAMTPEQAEAAFGVVPPDLSLIARARGTDWVYTYLKSFYIDPSRPTGVNNVLVHNVAMPNDLWDLQGVQEPLVESSAASGGEAVVGVKQVAPGSVSSEEFDRDLRDLVSFLAYVGEPSALQRIPMGKWVIAFLLVLVVLFHKLKKEYWKDVH